MDRKAEEKNSERRSLERADQILASYKGVCEDLNKALPFLKSAMAKVDSLNRTVNVHNPGEVRLGRYLKVSHTAKLVRSMGSHLAHVIRFMEAIEASSRSVRVLATDQDPVFTDFV